MLFSDPGCPQRLRSSTGDEGSERPRSSGTEHSQACCPQGDRHAIPRNQTSLPSESALSASVFVAMLLRSRQDRPHEKPPLALPSASGGNVVPESPR